MAARSISFVVRQKRKGGIRSLQQHMPPSAYSSALSDALFLLFSFFFLSHSEQRAIRTDIPASVAFEAAGSRRSTRAQSEGNTDAL